MAIIAMGDRAAAEALVTDLTPVAGLLAGAASTALAMQPVAQTLGELSALLGGPEAAARHFATAEQVARRWNSPIGPPGPRPPPSVSTERMTTGSGPADAPPDTTAQT